jgi:Tfp pilus assembly protein PilN
MLAELSRRIPSRVWLVAVEEKEHKMTIRGAGLSYDDVSEFIRALRDSGYFLNFKSPQQEEKPSPIPGMNFVEFTMQCDTKYAM